MEKQMSRKDILPNLNGPRFRDKNNQPISHYLMASTFTEFTVVPEVRLARINVAADLAKVGIIGCGVATGFGAACQVANVQPGSTCAVFGLGCVGLSTAIGCRRNGAKTIVGIDVNKKKKEKALALACTDFVDPTDFGDNFIQNLLSLTPENRGFDYVFEASGNITASQWAVDATKLATGCCCLIGVPPAGQRFTVDTWGLLLGKQLIGCTLGGYTPDDLPALVELSLDGTISLDQLVTEQISLDQINSAFDKLRSGQTIRSVINF